MTLYSYRKERVTRSKRMAQYISYISITVGSLLLFWTFYPIVSFWLYSNLFLEIQLKSPVPYTPVASSLSKASAVLGSSQVYSSNLRDFVKVNLWFPDKPQIDAKGEMSTKEYTISIPKINVMNAKVIVGGSDLSKNLIHYIPTSLPGESGNVAIFGHSTLPQLYNPKDYKTIFTYLPSLEKGDKIEAVVGGKRFIYQVYNMFVVDPDQVSVLEPNYDNSYLTLVTCVPPGTYWKRLIVKAKLLEAAY